MYRDEMTPMERVTAALAFHEPDRVPFFLLLTMHGARALGLGIREYFAKPEHVVRAQLLMQAKYRHDCLYPFFYAALEVEAFGGRVIYSENGPPNVGCPIIERPASIRDLKPPAVAGSDCLAKALAAISGLKQKSGDDIPIIGVVVSPFSMPVMQMGMEAYLLLMYEQPGLFWQLMEINTEFCIQWANAQLAAGATAICYFDPMSSPDMIPPELYRETGFLLACRTLAAIEGPTATHLASARCLPLMEDLFKTGTNIVCPGPGEELARVKEACAGRMAVLGNLNSVEMRRWSAGEAAERVQWLISAAAAGGGFILAESHGEIPYQVPEKTLMAIAKTVHARGQYPLQPHQG
jgi:uroporphyrinogen decarboxylase